MAAQPLGELGFFEFAGGEGQNGQHAFGIVNDQFGAVQHQKQFGRDQRGTHIAVDERMIANDAETKGGSECRDIRIAVGGKILGSCERRFEQTHIPYAGRAAMFG